MVYILDKLLYYCYNCSEIEKKLHKYQGYRPNSILKWKKNANLNWKTTLKILKNIKIIDGTQIRNIIKYIISQNNILFNQNNCYITSFGDIAKSSSIILYEFKHAIGNSDVKIIEPWKIPNLPQESIIIFVDDLIGTGNQSYKQITEKLNLILNPSHKPYLMCLFATPEGLNKVRDNTNFKILCGITLEENSSQFYSNSCKIFDDNEKSNLKIINNLLKNQRYFDFDRGLLISFYYSVPNSTMPIIWKDGFKYIESSGKESEWFALLPRSY